MKYLNLIVLLLCGCILNIYAQNADERLLHASLSGDFQEVKEAIKKGANIEAKTSTGWTALVRAANQGHTSIVEYLLDKGADSKVRCGEGTAITHATWNGHLSTVKLLLGRKAPLSFAGEMVPPIINAANFGYTEIVTLFLNHGVEVNSKDLIAGYGGAIDDSSPITKDKNSTNEESTKSKDNTPRLLPELLYFPATGAKNHLGGATPIIWASQNGHTDTVRLLIERGAEVNAVDDYENFALSVAVKGRYTDTIKLLLKNGATIEIKTKWTEISALIWAAKYGYVDVVKLLMDNGADIEARDSRYGESALMCAAEKGYTDVVRLLLESGADIEVKSKFSQNTALISAAENGHVDVVRLLIDHGANRNAKNKKENNALSLAKKNNHTEVIKILEQPEKYSYQNFINAAKNNNIERMMEYVGEKTTFISIFREKVSDPAEIDRESIKKIFLKLLKEDSSFWKIYNKQNEQYIYNYYAYWITYTFYFKWQNEKLIMSKMIENVPGL